MRPVNKPGVGNVVTVVLADGSRVQHTIQQCYPDYPEAKAPLTAALGEFCSYCEERIVERDLEVEHIEPKHLAVSLGNPYFRIDWNNFLLSCSTCNGRDNKGDKHVIPADMHLPHLNNTFLSFRYMTGGVIIVNPMLSGLSRTHAEATYKLLGLGKYGKNCNPEGKDKRWQKRLETWNTATEVLKDYEKGECKVSHIIKMAQSDGHWSIWFTIFEKHPEVRGRLISDFPDTASQCFDASNGFAPLPRNPQNNGDPV